MDVFRLMTICLVLRAFSDNRISSKIMGMTFNWVVPNLGQLSRPLGY